MDVMVLFLAALLVVAAVGAAILLTRGRGDRARLAVLSGEIAQERARAGAAQLAAAQDLAAKAAAETRLAEARRLIALVTAERDDADARRAAAPAARCEAPQA